MTARMAVFFFVMPLLWVGLHVYAGRRLIGDSGLRPPWRRVAWGTVAMLALLPPFTFLTLRTDLMAPSPALQWLGYLMMGLSSIVLVMLGEAVVSFSASLFKAATGGLGTAVAAVPQGAAAGYGSYIVGQAAKYYFEHGASWGGDGPKQVVRDILEQTDKQSVIAKLKDEIRRKISGTPAEEA